MYIKIVLGLAKVHEKKSYTVINNKSFNFGLLRSDKNRLLDKNIW